MANNLLSPVAIERATEQLRQERETFNQAKNHEGRWFILRLVMGYSAVVLLGAVMVVASYILFNAAAFPAGVVTAAGAALFVDVLGLLIAVWKIALNPDFHAKLTPVTREELPPVSAQSATPQTTSGEA
jgi:hypothetical protein